jgi:lipoprotein-releasing system ATP-binding protein
MNRISVPSARSPAFLLRAEHLTKTFHSADETVVVFADVSLEIRQGEFVALVGESGAGKTTLLYMLAALDSPTSGDVYFGVKPVGSFNADERAIYRNSKLGFVWQMHYLLPEFTALENVILPQLIAGRDFALARKQAQDLLEEVGLGHAGGRRAGELSGGEQQRVALARALVTEPQILMADEPTGDLDNRTADLVFALIQRLHREHQLTSLVVTHNLDFARRCDRALWLHQGKVEEVSPQSLRN